MKSYLNKIVCFLCILVFSSYFNTITLGNELNNMAKYVLNKMAENRNKVENYNCVFEVYTFHSEKERQALYKDYLEMDEFKKFAEQVLREIYTYRLDSLALDNQHRGRIKTITKEIDTQGKLTGKEIETNIDTWDGKSSIFYKEKKESSNAEIGGTRPASELTDSYAQPWRGFGGNFYDFFKKAFENNKIIDAQKQKDGIYKVEFLSPSDSRIVGLIDSNQGYSMISRETYSKGKLINTYKASFREVNPNIWFPVSGEEVTFENEETMLKRTMNIKEIKINDPNFYDGLYHVNFKEGTRVYDRKTGLLYVIGNPMSQQVVNSGSLSLDDIAKKGIEENPSISFEVFIPKASKALEEAKSFVFGFSDSKLVNPKDKPESEESDKFLTKLGKGDIAWDDKIIAVRGAVVLKTKENANKPIKSTKGNWSISYELPEKMELPYSFLIFTKEKENYFVNINKIEPEGITVSFKKLNYDEVDIYKADINEKN